MTPHPHNIDLQVLDVLLDEELETSGPVLKQCLANPSQSLPEKLNFYYALLNTLRAARHGHRAEKLVHDARLDKNKALLLRSILATLEQQLLRRA
ncbi:MAG: hypothetical protein WCA07_02470 [Gloeobacterales cyanobacterium]